MEAITDRPYRKLVRSLCREVILFTEFASAGGLLQGSVKVWESVEFDDAERPIVVQLYDPFPEKLGMATREVVRHLHPDGIDVNMGCPVRKVVRKGAGCGMMGERCLAVDAVRQVLDNARGTPVSIKTRLGIHDKTEVIELAQACIAEGVEQVTIHARLKADCPRTPADWEALSFAARQLSVTVIGNGDIWTEDDARRMIALEGISGVMIGRAAIGNPWLLKRCVQALNGAAVDLPPSREERVRVALEHLRLNVQCKGERRGVLEMRKVIRNYIKGSLNAKRIWLKIIQAETEKETSETLKLFAAT